MNRSTHIYAAIITTNIDVLPDLLRNCELEDLTPAGKMTALDVASDVLLDTKNRKTAKVFQLILNATLYHQVASLNVSEVQRLTFACGQAVDINMEVCAFSIHDVALGNLRLTKDLLERSNWQECFQAKHAKFKDDLRKETRILTFLNSIPP